MITGSLVVLLVGAASVDALMQTTGTTGTKDTMTNAGPSVKPDAVAKMAGSPPPASAKTATSVGEGDVKMSTADDDSYWVQEMDIDGDGNVEETDFVWDDEDKMLFAYADGTFMCKGGGTGSGGLLVGVNAAGNSRNRPAGSGFWVAGLDQGECNAPTAGLWGCRFNASGTATTCGVATIDEKTDDIVIVTVTR